MKFTYQLKSEILGFLEDFEAYFTSKYYWTSTENDAQQEPRYSSIKEKIVHQFVDEYPMPFPLPTGESMLTPFIQWAYQNSVYVAIRKNEEIPQCKVKSLMQEFIGYR
jgi:hypothetical protein